MSSGENKLVGTRSKVVDKSIIHQLLRTLKNEESDVVVVNRTKLMNGTESGGNNKPHRVGSKSYRRPCWLIAEIDREDCREYGHYAWVCHDLQKKEEVNDPCLHEEGIETEDSIGGIPVHTMVMTSIDDRQFS